MTIHTKAQVKQLLLYITEVRDAMRMQNWDVHFLIDDETDEDVYAHTTQSTNHQVINITIGPGFWVQDDEGKRNTIVHELIHALHRDVDTWAVDWVRDNGSLSQRAARGAYGDFQMFMERFVSDVTRMIAPTMPSWPPTVAKVGIGVRTRPEGD